MKVISIWQPFASLIVTGNKIFETRGWPAPASLIGQKLGIASTKGIRPEQRLHCQEPFFQECYSRTGLASWESLSFGFLLGTVELDSVEIMTTAFMDTVSREEQSYGWWEVGNYAWRLRNPIALANPIPIRGKQGLFDWHGDLNAPSEQEERQEADTIRAAYLWSGLSSV